ncbi:MAG: glycoside hydrolase family 1 protein [Candidatus Omnitrophica bacterium]|nr:glycoside hydrolase family 1 protein [Candidatus Omnitrophota bacterium]
MKCGFPPDFLWGSSISSYQTEGQNFTADWYRWEQTRNLMPAGDACRHYHLFDQDFALARSLSQKSIRLSLEWARICPENRTFSQKAIEHYRQVFSSLKRHNLIPLVTLHHFTNPAWFIEQGGWQSARNIDFFLKYVITAVKELGETIDYWIVFNEPLVYIYNGFIQGIWPPGVSSLRVAKGVYNNLLSAYITAYQEIKRIKPSSLVSIAKHVRVFDPCRYTGVGLTHLFAGLRSYFFNYRFLDACMKKNALDFLGVNYYCKEYVRPALSFFGKECRLAHHPERKNTLGWRVSAEGFLKILMCVYRRYTLPLIITENGTTETDDALYERYLIEHVTAMAKGLANKADIRGYFWWSLLDNFEWDKGYAHRFGLIEVDFDNFQRKIRPFARRYKQICEQNGIVS